jgi:predicted Zn-dependent protease
MGARRTNKQATAELSHPPPTNTRTSAYELLDAAKPKMSNALALDHARAFQLQRAGLIEQAETVAQQNRDEMQLDLVEQARFDELLRGMRTARHAHQFVAGSGLGLCQGLFDAVRNEDKLHSFSRH